MYYRVYENSGKNEWIMLLHGIGGSSSIWFKQLRYLKNNFNVVLVDLPGHGKSEKVNSKYGNKYRISDCILDLKELLDEILMKFNIDKIHMMGVSLGTILIHELLKTDSSKIKSIVLVGAVVKFNTVGNILVGAGNFLKNYMKMNNLYNIMAHILLPYKTNRLSRKLFIREAKKVKELEFRKWFAMLNEVENVYNSEVYNSKIDKLYVSGKLDYVFINGVKNNIVNDKYSKLKIIEKAGHVCNVDNSREFNDIIDNFYSEVV